MPTVLGYTHTVVHIHIKNKIWALFKLVNEKWSLKDLNLDILYYLQMEKKKLSVRTNFALISEGRKLFLVKKKKNLNY